MATEPAGGAEFSVSLPPSLAEWLDERAATLGMDREELLVQLVGSYRTAAEIGDEETKELMQSLDIEAVVDEAVADRLEAADDLGEIEGRLEAVETGLADNVEDLRSRVLQLRDLVQDRAHADHGHEEFDQLATRTEDLAGELETVRRDIEDLSQELTTVDDRFEDVEGKLDRLARVVLALRREIESISTTDAEILAHLRQRANRNGTTDAVCASCGERVSIGLLGEPLCPYCDVEFRDIEYADGRLRWFSTPRLVGPDTPKAEHDDE
ncbi:CopG domain protein [Natronomonas pharaonis DSM 2160]|uniref:CopG domain protein n=1 Tax=Natronomonas pharaonis (strain ATCC 35678 / DSM 2160 / CIP 103997 / JCM 8858 / NBRC 14720 / NCIMB 2260 / Gabara) TaxID=348780 RepID=A0A1U7EZ48_NATPD|nr:rad50 ATPase [Natronomonas pharaonis]CAI50558.1 CopG domain protein [Natronomonas pharaonis DSM 2160]